LSAKPFNDGPSKAAAIARAEESLVDAVNEMRRRLRLNRDTPAIVDDIKKSMHVKVPPHELTVVQALWDRERQKAFNKTADEFPEIRQGFDDAIQDIVSREGRVSSRKAKNVARKAWKEDPGANRRIHEEMKHPTKRGIGSVYRGRPELYDRHVVWAFADAIAKAAERKRFSIGHHGDVTIGDNKKGGAMLCTLVAAVEWAMTIAAAGSSEVAPPPVRPESILAIIKRRPLMNPTE
jgi:hypothetical protein